MANIRRMQMADAVCSHPRIALGTAMLGLRTTVTYTQTNSPCEVKYYEYSVEDGTMLEGILRDTKPAASRGFHPQPTVNGNYRVEICMARDHSFLAVNLLRYSLLGYKPVGEPLVFEAEEAEAYSLLFEN